MKTVIINGSPRKNWKTALLLTVQQPEHLFVTAWIVTQNKAR